ncbi:MAG: zinc ribbon domain-containing protein [Rhodopirellula sp. JB053]
MKFGCGKQLNVKDELAGKAIKCPGCGKVLRVGAAGGARPAAKSPAAAKPAAAKPAQSRPAASRPAASGPSGSPVAPAANPLGVGATQSTMDDLFAEEGLDREVHAYCPACNKELKPGSVLCTNCGFNLSTGEVLDGHKVAGVDIDKGTMALNKAERDIAAAKKAQADMIGKAGMPPWMLALVLFILGSAVSIAVLAVNASRREEAIAFNPMQMFMNLGGAAFLLVSIGALLSLIALAFRTDRTQGLLSLTILYLFVFPFRYGKGSWKILAVALVCGGIAGAFFAGASSM